MIPLTFDDGSLPADLKGKIAVITGGASGIGYSTAKLLVEKGATVHIIDLKDPINEDDDWDEWENFHIHHADVTKWTELRAAFDAAGTPDFVFANAGGPVDEIDSYFEEDKDADGNLRAPNYDCLSINTRGVLATIKLAWYKMKKAQKEGSIVITTSATAYFPEQGLPVWSATQNFVLGLVRALRNNLKRDNITINAVAPGAVVTGMLPWNYAVPMLKAGVPVGKPDDTAKALVYSAVAQESRRVEVYGKEPQEEINKPGRWNGRVIIQLGDKFVEVEEHLADYRDSGTLFDKDTLDSIKRSQALTDWRED